MTNNQETKLLITNFIKNEFLYDKPEITLTEDLNIIEQGILDSMDIFRLIQFIEEKLSITLEPEEMVQTNFQSINHILDFVNTKQNQ